MRRRTFLKQTALFTSWSVMRGAAFTYGANERLRVGAIGIAGQGTANINGVVAAGGEIVALCDVHESRKEVAALRQRFAAARFYADFRHMLDKEKLDAVIVSTPDHTHAPATLLALKAGCHVYCEKPLTHTVHEARLVAETAAREKRVTQMGTQIHAGSNYRRVVELIQTGTLGDVREVHVWCARSFGGVERPKETPPVPDGLHWDLWLGPAPVRPYHPTYVPFYWRRWWDFGGGTLADMGCHYLDLVFWALQLRHPTVVAAEGPKPHPESAAVWLIVHYEFPSRGNGPPLRVTWYDGGKRPKHFEEPGLLPKWGDGVLFVGTKGMLLADYSNHQLLPVERFAQAPRPKPFIPESKGHHREWVEACRGQGQPLCSFDYAGPLTETVLLGLVAYRLGRPIHWDAPNCRAINDPEADRFLRKEYRKGWQIA
ncbi:MAG: Gfo/Idh/MocA family oxidoreductase [Gemmatales bacterium]|nr:Gfo/Idh/MocA family oxidoreductase [Gemmatales bacterium]MCS7158925.1 Gfo/Idh/MocA family oxidoreductase [Gemmatales bacterium]MDW8174124.1 Gfo/Idh/MocA family oxidoreductase [Gemmatales bacterium]MDW8223352.1 Gfo/Idh/MocA family oxidoreductase [Gemmatales bacterium]